MRRVLDTGIVATPADLAEVLGPAAHDAWAQKLRGRFVDTRYGERFELGWNGYGEALIIKPRRRPEPPAVRPELVLIGCSAVKLARPAPARELYRGQLFRLAVRWAKAHGLPWAVLSAKHGVVEPDQLLEPYDQRLPTNDDSRKSWVWRVNWQTWTLAPYGRLWLLCGREYTQAFQGPIHDQCLPGGGRPFELVQPFAGLGIGEQRGWLGRGIADQVQPRLFA